MGNCFNPGPRVVTHELSISTGDKKGRMADMDVFIMFTDVQGKNSPEIQITHSWRKHQLTKGKAHEIKLDLGNLGKVVDITIRRNEGDKNVHWFVEKMAVTYGTYTSVFPINRWIRVNTTLSIAEYDSELPQFSKHKQQREDELKWKRTQYVLQSVAVGVPPEVKVLPDNEKFSTKCDIEYGTTGLKALGSVALIDLSVREFQDLSDFDEMYKGIFYKPESTQYWKDDEAFGNQRLSGVNPIALELIQEIPAHLAVTAELVEPHLEGKELSDCLKRNKIYLVDYRYLADLEYPSDVKIPGPTALFYVKDSGALVPIAIQLMPEPGEDNPVFTPSDPEYTWIAAKIWFNLTDACQHEPYTHFTATHVMIGCVSICANRQLSPSHPVFRLLAPHFYQVLAINDAANDFLINPGGLVDQVMMISHTGFINVIIEKWKDYDVIQDGNILKSMKKRGVDDPEQLPNYHYRDDATLLWNSIHNYVSTVISNVYSTTELITGDTELQAWLGELTSGGSFKGLPETFATKEEVTEIVTIFIFTASAQHSAVNFMQYAQYGFPPFYPAWLRGTWPISKAELEEKDIISILPNKDQAKGIMLTTTILSDNGTNSLGYFEVDYAYDPDSLAAVRKFRDELKEVSSVIEGRNQSRRFNYPYLNPKHVPNSISI